MTTLVKICGITNDQDALLAAESGASFVGMIFVQSSPRNIDLAKARCIVSSLANQIQLVGVFQNQSVSDVNEIAEILNLDFVQLHGTEGPDYCLKVERPVIKAFPLKFATLDIEKPSRFRKYDDVELVSEIQRYPSMVKYFLFDKPKSDDSEGWLENAIARLKRLENDGCLPPYFFAGGLNHFNVATVLNKLHPFAIDVASGVEASPGIKDKRLVQEFITAVKRTNKEHDLVLDSLPDSLPEFHA